MFLKRLEIFGFKSFAEKTVFDFEKGITCVIGPNGTGKSNLVEAILWVLGSQNPRDLRGNKMEDIIFNGSNKRKPLGFTYVTIILDNSDKLLNIAHSEIAITRKYYRSGEGEFYINNTECRLKDIIDLFTDTGLGKNGYSIIGQGKIDEILNSRPEEKRGFFEEAAGIMKYKNKRNESIKKLNITQDNLNRLNDIISELHERLIPLYRESIKAKEYEDISKKYKSFRINYFLMNYKKIKDEHDSLFAEIEGEKDKLKTLNTIISETEKDLNELNRTIENLKNDEASNNSCLYTQRNLLEKYRGEINLLNLKLSGALKESESNELKIHELIKNLRSWKDEVNRFKAQISVLDTQGNVMDIHERNFVKNIDLIENLIKTITIINNTLKNRKDNLEREILIKNNEIKHIKNDLTEKINNMQTIEAKYNKQLSVKLAIKEAISKLIHERKIIRKDIQPIKREISLLENKISFNKNIYIKYMEKANSIKKNIQIINTRVKALDDMKKNYDGLNDGSKYLLNLHDKNVYGFVGELIELDKKYERAIETALGGSIEYLIVDSEDDAKRLISVLKEKKAGRATFIPLSSVKPRPYRKIIAEGFLGRASELVHCNQIFRNVMEFLLGNIYVFDSIDNAIEVSKHYGYSLRAVTLGGENVSPGGLITGGFHRKSYNFFTRENEIKKLKTEVEEYNQNLKKINKDIEDVNNDIQTQELKYKELTQNLSTLLAKDKMIDEKLKELFANHRENKRNIFSLTKQIDSYNSGIQEIKQNCEIFEQEVTDNEFKTKQIDLIINHLNVFISELEGKRAKTIKAFEDFKINNATSIMEKQSLNQHYEEISNKLNEGAADLRALLSERCRLKKNIREFKKLIERELNRQQDLIEQISDLEEKSIELKQKIVTTENQKNDKDKDYKTMQNNVLSVNNSLKELEIRTERSSSEINSILSRLNDEFDLTLDEAFTYEDELILENDVQKEMNYLKRRLDLLGNVNVNAIEEYKQVKERYDFLTSQYKDTAKSKNSLLKIINDTDKIILDRFNNFLKQANITFRDNFVKLFGGGQANIVLTDNDHPEESGIDVIVQPPGKRLQSMSLLSGGERALVAIALLFSLLQLNHSPFVILDEIDSALDDSNIERFVNFLKHLSKDIQFILITHRPGTADAADFIYGITMEEKGVTKKISIKLKEVADWR